MYGGTFWLYHMAGFFRGRKLSRISRVCGDSQKVSPRKSIIKQLDTALVDVVHWVTANSRKFLRENLFSSNSGKFSPAKETRYTVYRHHRGGGKVSLMESVLISEAE